MEQRAHYKFWPKRLPHSITVPAGIGSCGGPPFQQRLPVRALSLLFAALLVAIAVDMLIK